MSFKRIFKRYPFLYKIWFYTIRIRTGDKVRLPQKGDHLYFDGYPRSGNTYFGGLVSYVFKGLEFTSHLHVIAGIKVAFKYNLPVFIIIRKPQDVIASNLFRKTKKKNLKPTQGLVDQLFVDYIDYYTYVRLNKNRIHVLDFAKATQEPKCILEKLLQTLQFQTTPNLDLVSKVKLFDQRMREKEENKISATSALPNEERKVFKNKHMDLVLNSQHLEEANKLHKMLVANDLLNKESTEAWNEQFV